MDTSALAKRMKKYEAVPKNTLMRRTPVIIRVDGRAFHTFTKGFQKPFDDVLMRVMQDTMKYLCENIQGCVFGYTQSDEITLILIDYKKLNSEAWFDYEVQKMCSIVASMATMAFNRFFMYEYEEFNRWIYEGSPTDEDKRLNDVYYNARRVISISADGTVTCEIRNPKEPETAWVIDNEIPIFKGEGRKYIDELIFIGGVEI